jgi:predicted nucleic acid-binding protein
VPTKAQIIVDCSVTVAWLFHDEKNPYADAVAARLPNLELVVPALWHLKVANVLLVGERRKRSTQADTIAWTGFLKSLSVEVDGETTARAWTDILSLARAHNLSAYDASYLELGLRRGLPLASLDDQLKAAASAVGVAAFQP